MPKRVYLSGPISGLTYGACTDWRKLAAERLAGAGLTGLSPMRGMEFIAALQREIPPVFRAEDMDALLGGRSSVQNLDKFTMHRDRFDATRSDALLVNLLGAKRASIGTVMEITWAEYARVPVFCAIEPTGNIHEHTMLNEAITGRFATLEDAILGTITYLGD